MPKFFHQQPSVEKSHCMSTGVRAGDPLFFGGLTATDNESSELHAGDAGFPIQAIYRQMGDVLTAQAGKSSDVVNGTIYYNVSGKERGKRLFPHGQAFYSGHDALLVAGPQVSAFANPAIQVELTAIASFVQGR